MDHDNCFKCIGYYKGFLKKDVLFHAKCYKKYLEAEAEKEIKMMQENSEEITGKKLFSRMKCKYCSRKTIKSIADINDEGVVTETNLLPDMPDILPPRRPFIVLKKVEEEATMVSLN